MSDGSGIRVELRDVGDGTITTQLQTIVDDAAGTLRRPIAIDDRQLRLLAYTEHPADEVDDVRLLSVLKQPFPPEVLDWVEQAGVGVARSPVIVPENAPLGLWTRVCVPILCHDYLLGYLWLIDRDGSVGDEDLARAQSFADQAGLVLYRELLLRDIDRAREREFLRDILSDDHRVREDALASLAELDLFTTAGPVVVLVVRVARESHAASPEAIRLAFDAELMRARRQLAAKHALHLMRPDHALMLVSLADASLRAHGLRGYAERLRRELGSALGLDESARLIVAMGGEATDHLHVGESYRQALRAADVAAAVSNFGDVVGWDDVGVYRVVATLPQGEVSPDLLHPGLLALIRDPRRHALVRTLECYLDLGGEAQATAAKLFLHRTSLYHRLRRVEREAGVDLAKGDDRLILHLSLKIARLQGLSWADGDEA